ncbi:MAG: Re/Si-specific NAD(P)(+) transhydrogenase subunit alpha [Planctomycetota bacterium]|jgi:NAD(P) transhydrogenase subunit alpha
MVIALVSKESNAETRVACTPGVVKQLVDWGFEVQVEDDAGTAAGFTNEEYQEAGAKLVHDAAAVRGDADLILGIHPPSEDSARSFKNGATLICGLQPMLNLPLVKALAEAGVTTFAMDLMPRITRAQKMDVLSSQATAAGYQAVLLAASALPRMFPLMMTASGTITPAKVLVLGVGVAGLQAIATAKRLGAVVEANDIRPEVKEQVESLGAKFVDTGTPPQMEAGSVYAKETSQEYQEKQRTILTEHMKHSDVVITTALIPGKKAPVLITKDMVAAMHTGSVIVDLAVEMGGNVEGSEKGKTVDVGGVTIIGESNLPGLVAADASHMYARNIGAFLGELVKDGNLEPNWEDEVVIGTLVTRKGEICHEGAESALQSTQSGGAS